MHWGPTPPFSEHPLQTTPKPFQAQGRVTTVPSIRQPSGPERAASCTVDRPPPLPIQVQDPDLGKPATSPIRTAPVYSSGRE